MIKKGIFIQGFILLIIIVLIGIVCRKDRFNHPKPVNADISNEAKALLDLLYKISGKYILSGHHNGIESPTKYNEEVNELTGYFPVVWGSDFSFRFRENTPDVVRQQMIDKAKEIHQRLKS